MMTYDEAVSYVRKVITKWSLWGTHHKLLIKAIEVILQHIDEGGNNEPTKHTTRDKSS